MKRASEPDYDAEMRLPEGKTCGDCVHIRRCLGIGYTSSASNTSCDFHPSRFRLPVVTGSSTPAAADQTKGL